jgi:WD40 repeat protein
MAVASDTVCIWKVEKQHMTLAAELRGHGNEVYCLLQLPDGRLVTGSSDRTLRIWDPSSEAGWHCCGVLRGHTGSVHSLAYLASGELVSGSTDGTVRVWNLSSSECVLVLEEHKGHGRVKALAVLPDQRLVSADDDGNLLVWT